MVPYDRLRRRGDLRVLEVQRSGKAPMPAGDFLRGARIAKGMLLG